MAPVTERFTATIPAATIAADQDTVVAESHVAGVVSSVTLTPEAAVTANATNYRTFSLVNKGTDGTGTTAIATLALDTPTTDDLVAFDEKTIPLSATPANLAVAVGDVLLLVETHAASGLAHSGGRLEVEITRTA